MSVEVIKVAALVGFAIIMVASFLLHAHFASSAKRDMQCIACESQDILLEIQTILSQLNIQYTFFDLSPSRMAYNNLAMARHAPKELWIKKRDLEPARRAIKIKFKTKTTDLAILVSDRVS